MLAQLSTLKARLGLTAADTDDDALLLNALAAFSQRFEDECNRKFARQEAAQYEFVADAMEIVVDRAPIEIVMGFFLKTTEAAGFNEIIPTPDYLIRAGRQIIHLGSPLGGPDEVGMIEFTGGYVLPGDAVGEGQTALPADLEQAVIEQATYWYQRRNQLGLVSVSGEGGSISQFASLDLLPNVKAVLRGYERFVL